MFKIYTIKILDHLAVAVSSIFNNCKIGFTMHYAFITKSKNSIYFCEWHSAIIYLFKTAIDILRNKLSVEDLHNYLYKISSIENWSKYFILVICDSIHDVDYERLKNHSHKYLFYSRYDYRKLCPSPCKREHCDFIQYAIKGSCKDLPNALKATAFKCSCLSPWVWDQKNLACVEPNFKNVCERDNK
jgi:hypothetical protein